MPPPEAQSAPGRLALITVLLLSELWQQVLPSLALGLVVTLRP